MRAPIPNMCREVEALLPLAIRCDLHVAALPVSVCTVGRPAVRHIWDGSESAWAAPRQRHAVSCCARAVGGWLRATLHGLAQPPLLPRQPSSARLETQYLPYQAPAGQWGSGQGCGGSSQRAAALEARASLRRALPCPALQALPTVVTQLLPLFDPLVRADGAVGTHVAAGQRRAAQGMQRGRGRGVEAAGAAPRAASGSACRQARELQSVRRAG